MKIIDLLNKTKNEITCVYGDVNAEIDSIEYDSRNAGNGSLFIAIQITEIDRHDFIDNAVENGAVAVMISADRANDFSYLEKKNVTVLTADDTRKALSGMSAAFYDFPSKKVPVIGVTGTKGKTSITYLVESVLKEAGMNPGVIGTINCRWMDKSFETKNTTPESRDIQKIMAEMVSDGADSIIMEVSSHALDMNRADNIDFDYAVFSNLTQDHLDYHKTFEKYFEAKRILFRLLDESPKRKKAGIVNVDNEYGRRLFDSRNEYSSKILSLGINSDADFKIKNDSLLTTKHGTSYEFEKPERMKINLEIIGDFQIYNSAAAFAVCRSMEIPGDVIARGLHNLKKIPGRFNLINTHSGFTVVLDYAHTDDSVSKMLESVKELKPERIITLLGCGGDRDKTKRPKMGHAAVSNSDHVIFTSDNPRSEDPDEIIKDIVRGMKETNYEIIADRDEAIKKAVFLAKEGDIVVLAGKGHETYQTIKGRNIHFDDSEVALKHIKERESN